MPIFDRDTLFRLLAGVQASVSDAAIVGSALGKGLRDAGCTIAKGAEIDADGTQKLTLVSPGGMEFELTLKAIGVRCVCGQKHGESDQG